MTRSAKLDPIDCALFDMSTNFIFEKLGARAFLDPLGPARLLGIEMETLFSIEVIAHQIIDVASRL